MKCTLIVLAILISLGMEFNVTYVMREKLLLIK